MTYIKSIPIIILALSTSFSLAQEVSQHQWKNRVLLILTNSLKSNTYQNQIKELLNDSKGLKERKLIVYQVQTDSYKIGFKNTTWQSPSKLYSLYKKGKTPFEIILIGLDGGIKLRQTHLLSCKKLFATIDIMPMRLREINKKK